MVRWGFLGGRVHNNSKKWLIVAYDHPTKDNTWAYSYLTPGKASPLDLDIDGFRAYDTDLAVLFASPFTGSTTSHTSWWKLRNGHIAVVNDGASSSQLEFSILTDDAFGLVTWASMPVKKTNSDFGWVYGKETLPLPDY
jgi:hypothetical protein